MCSSYHCVRVGPTYTRKMSMLWLAEDSVGQITRYRRRARRRRYCWDHSAYVWQDTNWWETTTWWVTTWQLTRVYSKLLIRLMTRLYSRWVKDGSWWHYGRWLYSNTDDETKNQMNWTIADRDRMWYECKTIMYLFSEVTNFFSSTNWSNFLSGKQWRNACMITGLSKDYWHLVVGC